MFTDNSSNTRPPFIVSVEIITIFFYKIVFGKISDFSRERAEIIEEIRQPLYAELIEVN